MIHKACLGELFFYLFSSAKLFMFHISRNMCMVELSCLILAGGIGKRMGENKRQLVMNGKTFLEIAVENAHEISSEVALSLRDESQTPTDLEGVLVVYDEIRGRGPLFAFASALKKCSKPYVAVLPVDSPLINVDIYRKMWADINSNPSLDAVIPKDKNTSATLMGIYKTSSLLHACNKAISGGSEKLRDAVGSLGEVLYLGFDEFRQIDPKLLSFFNVNTPSDFKRLKEIRDG